LSERRLAGPGRALAAVLALALCAVGGAEDGARTVRDRVFTVQQAARGERLFESICTSCHEIEEFTGSGAYLDSVESEPLWKTFEYVAEQMPEDDPGSLAPAEYAAVLAYLMRAYGLPDGGTDLPTDQASLERLLIAGPIAPDE
jgi:mono/diheme cytochrome c family protein